MIRTVLRRVRAKYSHRASIVLVACAHIGAGMAQQEIGQALILAGGGARLTRAGSELDVAARDGEVVFAGDFLRTGTTAAIILSCASNTRQTLGPGTDALFERSSMKLRSGKVTAQQPAPGCFLPPLARTPTSQQHAGAALAQEAAAGLGGRSREARLARIPATQRTRLEADLTQAGEIARGNPDDPLSRLARAAAFERAGLSAESAEELRIAFKIWTGATWLPKRIYSLMEKAGREAVVRADPERVPSAERTLVLLVGISEFRDARIAPLQFAHKDAIDFAGLLESERGGGVPARNIELLTNKDATRQGIRNAIETHLKAQARVGDTVILFIASHGAAVPVKGRNRGFVVTWDSDPEDLAETGIPMEDIRKLFESELPLVKRLILYVDVCHAGHVGQVVPRADLINNAAAGSLANTDVEMFGMLAAQKNQVAIEGINFGGGHGAFSYFLMRALNGDARQNSGGMISTQALFEYVSEQVKAATANRQSPKAVGDPDEALFVARIVGAPAAVGEYTGPVQVATRSGLARIENSSPESPAREARRLQNQDAGELLRLFSDAIEQGRILPGDTESAFLYLEALRARLKQTDYAAEANRLRTALEDRGQQVLLTYLAGEASPQRRDDFYRGLAYFEAAQLLTPDAVDLESRRIFCEGRVALFDKEYVRAEGLLEQAVGLDPEGAYAYNALGIAALERASYDRAAAAFHEAVKRAPLWAYPRHNLALAQVEKGAYGEAVSTYQGAIALAPGAAYLPYNLGLLFQKMNRGREAARQYRRTLEIEPANAAAWNALGSLAASTGKRDEAEQNYRRAIAADAGLLAARYNLALLLDSAPRRAAEAAALLRENVGRDPHDLASRLVLARHLAASGDQMEAIVQYEAAVSERPEYPAARAALAALYIEAGRAPEAIVQAQAALAGQPKNADLLDLGARAYYAADRRAEADEAWRCALQESPDGATKKRIRKSMEKTKLARK